MKNKEPLIRVVKRGNLPWYGALAIRIGAIVLALLLCGIVTAAFTGYNPLEVYGTMVKGAFGSARKSWVTFQNVAVLLIVSLAVTPAFRMRFWNIGAEGQVLVGCLAASACMITLADKLPNAVIMVLMTVSALAAGAIWGLIPALFRARWNTNETLFTLMMNYVATQLVAYFVIVWEAPKGSGTIGIINQSTEIGWMALGNKYLLTILVAAALTVFMYIYLKYTKHGYEISVVGESERTARYVGINVKKVVIRTMLLSGAICGIAGLLLVSGTDHSITRDTIANRGFTAILVSWLAKFNPVYMILTAFLIVFLQRGALEITSQFTLSDAYSEIITGIIIFFIIGSEFFLNYELKFRHAAKEEKK